MQPTVQIRADIARTLLKSLKKQRESLNGFVSLGYEVGRAKNLDMFIGCLENQLNLIDYERRNQNSPVRESLQTPSKS